MTPPPPLVYLIGSMRNPQVPIIANAIRDAGFECFDDWYAPGPEADERWREYELHRGRSYADALNGAHAQNVFDFDLKHLQQADMVVLALPAGKSGHLELGWMLGQGKPGFILLEPEMARYDVMHRFATAVFASVDEMIAGLQAERDREKIWQMTLRKDRA